MLDAVAGRTRARPLFPPQRTRVGCGAGWYPPSVDLAPSSRESARLEAAYRRVRRQTMELVSGLTPEDCMVQSMDDASPVKWHLAHVTWFFETLVLEPWLPMLGASFAPFRPEFRVLFNSYYQGVGPLHPRPYRDVLSRP